jgi:phenylacetate-coenzyme A ligase PaaK-like adenylate-forming protein
MVSKANICIIFGIQMATNLNTGINEILSKKVFKIESNQEFDELALDVFLFQYQNNIIYRNYADAIGKSPLKLKNVNDIPFLPISFFKTHKVICGENAKTDTIFQSSTTTLGTPSIHAVKDIELYKQSFRHGFKQFYGDIKEYCILALLPSYLERKGSSLVFMAEDMLKESNNPASGFYLHNIDELKTNLEALEKKGQKTLLIGVTYALLDFAAKYSIKLRNTIIMETGGMKGKRKEMPREEVHALLKRAFGLDKIHSEYGMTELLSQAYSQGNGIFKTPPWMKIVIRDVYDPLRTGLADEGGAINIIDLANIYSCSFIATDDAGIKHKDESFEISGRLDQSDVRGCNLMAEEI